MDSVQALAITAAAFVTSLSLDGALATERFTAQAEAVAERALAQADLRQAMISVDYAATPQWRGCERTIKAGRL